MSVTVKPSRKYLHRLLASSIPALLLVAVALHQTWRATTGPLSPWHGGGFGMFAAIDAGGSRHLHVFARGGGLRNDVAVPDRLEMQARRLLALPTEHRLRGFAAALLKDPQVAARANDGIEIQVWGVNYRLDDLGPSAHIVTSIRFESDEFAID